MKKMKNKSSLIREPHLMVRFFHFIASQFIANQFTF
jgi:hypothetical protein